MATQKLGKAAEPERITDYTRNRLCAEHKALDDERLKLEGQARAKAKRVAEIDDALCAQLKLDGASVCDLARWQFGLELVAGYLSYKDELVSVIGYDELERRKAAVPPRERFFLRDKGPPAAKRTTAKGAKRANKKAA